MKKVSRRREDIEMQIRINKSIVIDKLSRDKGKKSKRELMVRKEKKLERKTKF